MIALFSLAAIDPLRWRDAVDSAASSEADAARTKMTLERQSQTIDMRLAHKNALIDDLLAGHRTLADVATEFVRLERLPPSYFGVLKTKYPAASDEESAANSVFEFVNLHRLTPQEEARALVRLRLEFQKTYGHPPRPTWKDHDVH
ncbi:hypothetical protein FRUB_05478 [Fimbriiglobus ruber]|uniref:Uncharacterized protein n=1 Tax=Fimbriiglobus ruber TaxID=1908690 RepID=A0A225DTQ4_9BACT|nr:hypothetical protein FRUB_05478 [Fimbriiglobus ruber]